jgi:pimeloyl-ACP methyl ester carboxylesterase
MPLVKHIADVYRPAHPAFDVGRAVRTRRLRSTVIVLLAAATALTGTPAQAEHPPRLPIVFVHGNSGSAAQFETQFQRFAANGYPARLLFAYEYDTSVPDNTAAVADLGPFVDDVLARTGADQVLLAAHSRGTTVSHTYLADPAHAAEVARYVNLDGRSSETPPGGVPTLAVWGEWQSPPDPVRGVVGSIGGARNVYNRDFGHTETATAERTFAEIFRFWFGRRPATTEVVPEPPNRVEVAGRVVLFPQNVGYDGARLDVWEVDASTGQRRSSRPVASYPVDETGEFGPLRVHGRGTYEFAVTREDGSVHHFYQQRFTRDDYFLRLNTGRPGEGLEAFTKHDPRHVNLTFVRGREMWGDQPDSDVLTVDRRGDGAPALNVLTPGVAPRTGPGGVGGNTGEVNALFLTDVGDRTAAGYADPDQRTDLGKNQLFPFDNLTFLAAADVFVPAAARGTAHLAMVPRGGHVAEVVNVPAWPSDEHRITVAFKDYVPG